LDELKAIKQVCFKVYGPDHKTFDRLRFRSDKGQTYSKAKIEQIKTAFMVHLQDSFPQATFRCVQTGKAEFSVVHNGGEA